MTAEGSEDRTAVAVSEGEPVDLSGEPPVRRTLRATWLSELLTMAPPSGGRVRPIRISGARILGPLELEGCTLTRPLLLNDCHFDGMVTLDDAIAPAFRLRGCHLSGLSARSLRTTGDVEFGDGSTVEGTIDLQGADISGMLSLRRTRLINPGRIALEGSRLTVGQHMLCEGLRAEGGVSLVGARIPHLDMSGAVLNDPNGTALNAYGITVQHDLLCNNGFRAAGEVNLCRARIEGQLYLDGAHLATPGGRALHADALTIGQSLFCRDGFTTDGELRIIGAHIGGVCNLTGARLHNPSGRALYAVRLRVDGDLLCRDGFTADGDVQLSGGIVAGQLDMRNALLRQALTLEAARADEFMMLPSEPPGGTVDLTNTQVRIFQDEQATWPAALRLEGFAYDTLANDTTDVRDRLRWLTRDQGGYRPHAYDRLAAAYRRVGHEEAARRVAIAKQQHRRQHLNLVGRLANLLLYVTVGYGYRTRLAAAWLAGLLGAGTWLFAHAHPDAMTRSTPNGPSFNAFAYTLDVLLPVVDLGQQKAWHPQGTAMYCSWALAAAGWILATALVAGLTGVMRRD